MTQSRVFGATMAALALGAALAPAGARSEGAPCRLVWDETTSGGDTQTTHAELQITRSAPLADGSLMMFGAGQASVTYHSANGCRIASGSPFTANVTVILNSEDGRTADIDINSTDPSHPVVTFCGPGEFTADVDMSLPPTVTVPLEDGASTPYSTSGGIGLQRHGTSGTVTLHYCKDAGR